MDAPFNNEIVLYGAIIFLLLLVSAFFSAAETALTAISRARIYQLVMDGNKRAQLVSKLRRNKESMIGAVLLGNNAVNILASALATTVSVALFGSEHGLVVVTIVMTLLVVIFSEVLPKTYAIQNAERVSLALAPILHFLIRVLYPFTHAIQMFIRLVLRAFGIDITKTNTLISATDVLRGTIELHHREGQMIKQDRDMLGSILDLNDIEVKDIMIHRKNVETLDADLDPGTLIRQAVSTLHSRIPLWRGEPDNIIGVLIVKNLVKAIGEQSGRPLDNAAIMATCRQPWFIPETTNLRSQLLAFRGRREHFAFVVDEYGAWQGIVTLEDIIEEIVGNIEDEHDEAARNIVKISANTFRIDGNTPLRDLNRQLDWNLPDEHASTIAGLLIHEAQNIPSIGEHFEVHGFRFTVLGKDATHITSLRVEKLPHAGSAEDMDV